MKPSQQSVSQSNKSNLLIKLGLAAGLAFYIGLIAIQAQYRLFEYDFISFWSVGRIANTDGYSHIYDLSTLAKYQHKNNMFEAVPAPFPAVFILPFQVIALLPEETGSWVWRFINLAAFISYCIFFSKKIQRFSLENEGLLALLLSLPVYINFAWAQVNVVAMIGIGEFIRFERRYLRGAALGLLLIKPQILLLIIPILLFQKEWETLAGFIISAAVILLSSVALTGVNGIFQLVDLWIKYSTGLPSNEPEHMINWRMIAIQIGALMNSQPVWLAAIIGVILTGVCAVSLWRRQPDLQKPAVLPYLILNALSATLLISWHSHLHHMLILIPPLIAIAVSDHTSQNFILRWMFSGIAFYLTIFVIGFLGLFAPTPGSALLGVWGFSSNLIFLGWSYKKSMRLG